MAKTYTGYENKKRDSRGRWLPNSSGNPKGRPPGRKRNWAAIAAILNQPVPVRLADGTIEHVDALERSFKALCAKALKLDRKSLFEALEIMERVTPADDPEPAKSEDDWEKTKQEILAAFPEINAPENKGKAPAAVMAMSLFRAEVEAELDEKGITAPED